MLQSIQASTDLDFRVWSVVDAGLGSLYDIQERWSLEDLGNALEYMEIKEEINEVAEKFNQARSK